MISGSELVELFLNVLEVDQKDFDLDTVLSSVEEYDSLGALSFFTAISEKTDGQSDELDFTDCASLNEILSSLAAAGLAK